MGNENNNETFGAVLKKNRAILIVVSSLLLLVVGASFLLEALNRNKAHLHDNLPAADLGLRPMEILSESTEGNLGTVLTETTVVGADYFTDTVFIGDSLTDGIRIYDVFGDVTAISFVGVNSHSAMTSAFYDTGDGNVVTMVEAIEFYKPRKVYIMLGTNGINFESVEWNLEGYTVLVDELLSRVPGCAIVIQSIPPVSESKAAADTRFSRENIGAYNAGLLDLAMKKGVYFLDVHTALCDEKGFLRADIAASDGIHMSPTGYQLWYDLVVSRAVKGESAYCIDEFGLIMFVEGAATPQPEEPNQDSGAEQPPEA